MIKKIAIVSVLTGLAACNPADAPVTTVPAAQNPASAQLIVMYIFPNTDVASPPANYTPQGRMIEFPLIEDVR